MLKLNVIRPPQDIAEFVKHFWVLEGKVTRDKPYVHRVLAESCPELIFYYKGYFRRFTQNDKVENCFLSGIYGQKQIYEQFTAHEDFGILGVSLYPYSIYHLFSHPTSELSDNSSDLKTLLGKNGEILEEKVLLAPNNSERIKLISEFLFRRLVNVRMEYSNITNVIRNTLDQNYAYSIDKLASDCNRSRRQFERKFREFSGFSPRVFLNIARFNRAIKNNLYIIQSLTKIAYECGYCDQSHFIRDFRKFSGYSPKEYFKNTNDTDYRATTDFQV